MSSSSNRRESAVRDFVRRAVHAGAPLLAVPLYRYAEAEGMSWEQLAAGLGCTVEALDQVALCLPPRDEHFVSDVAAIAGEWVDPARLLPVLRRLQVLSAMAGARAPETQSVQRGASTAPAMYFAARVCDVALDYREEKAPPDEEDEAPDDEDAPVQEKSDPTISDQAPPRDEDA